MINTQKIIAGVDEAGRGPLAGPVVAAAVILPKDHTIEGLIDSKKLSAIKREKLYNEIIKVSDYGIGIISHRTIDKINILQATFKAMRNAILNLDQKPDKTLIDGYGFPDQTIKNEGIIGGDNLIKAISAASIIAKVTRDRIMMNIDKIFPEYGFAQHKGYGTKMHMKTLNVHKASPVHRKSFGPVKRNIPKMEWLKNNNKFNSLGIQLVCLNYLNQNFTILHINFESNINKRINIILMKENVVVFVKVVASTEKIEKINILNLNQDEIDKMKYEASKYNQEISNIVESKFEIAAIVLKKNPIINIYDILNID